MIASLEKLQAFAKTPVTKWETLYSTLCALGCQDVRYVCWDNFLRRRTSDIDSTLEFWLEFRQKQVIEQSITAASGFSRVLNRLRSNEETPITTAENLLPYPIPGSKSKGFAVTDRDRNTIAKLKKKGYLTDRQEMIFLQLGVLKNGG